VEELGVAHVRRRLACAAVRRIALIPLLILTLATPAAAASPPPHWTPDAAAARAYAAARAGDVSFAVRTERRAWSWRGTTTYRSASIVKAMLLVAYLRRADVRDRPLRAGERALLDPMVRRSDNRAANAIHARVGLAALTALGRRVGMRQFIPHPVWGGSTVTAADQARLFLRIDRLVPRRHRAYAMGLLRGVIPGQRWGIAAAVPFGWEIAFKGGWGRGVTRQVDHQAALLTNAGLRVSVAVLTGDNPSDGYGTDTIRGVAARLLRGLDGRVLGTVVRCRWGLGATGRDGRAGARCPLPGTGAISREARRRGAGRR
jgi:beta-lactamase class A